MKVVIAPDSFKESLTAKQVCDAIQAGLARVWHDAKFVAIPVADGGEGTVQSLVDATQGRLVEVKVMGHKVNEWRPSMEFWEITKLR